MTDIISDAEQAGFANDLTQSNTLGDSVKAYVQRVIENSVVYDRMNPGSTVGTVHVSNYLGKSRPG